MATCKSMRRGVRCDAPLHSPQFLADAAEHLRELATHPALKDYSAGTAQADATGRLSGCAQSVADMLEEAATGICTYCHHERRMQKKEAR